MRITKRDFGTQEYPVFSIDGRIINPNGLEPEVAGGVYSIANNIYTNQSLDGLPTREAILQVIKDGVDDGNMPSIVAVAKKFPDYIAKDLLKVN